MLTKDDFSKFKKLIREEVEAEGENIKSDLSSDIQRWGLRTATELNEVNDRLKNLEISLRKEMKKLGAKVDRMDNFLDENIMNDRKRIDKIEKHLGFPEPQIA